MSIKWITGLLLVVLAWPMQAQNETTDSILTVDQLLWLVESYHPIALRANLLDDKGNSTVRKARGAFDPYLYTNLDQKNYDDKFYYSVLSGGLKVPTWYGIELKTGYDQNRGVFLNPENNTPTSGLWNAGLSVNIGQGLIFDKRRAALKQAQNYAASTEVERLLILNNLFFDAVKQYWYWAEAWNQLTVYEDAVGLAETRFNAVKQTHRLGDIPAIDTLEAFIQLQNRQIARNDARLQYQNTTLELSNFLWFENLTPLVITDNLRPLPFNSSSQVNVVPNIELSTIIDGLAANHPELRLYNFKLDALDIERRLKIEGLKPKLSLSYNFINEPVNANIFNDAEIQNYKWGFKFSMPLLFRQQRGQLQLTKIKIQETLLGQRLKQQQIQNKVNGYFNQVVTLQEQLVLYQSNAGNYQRLLQGEQRKFNLGESSLFLINSREVKLIEAQTKLMEAIAKYNISLAGIQWAAGQLVE